MPLIIEGKTMKREIIIAVLLLSVLLLTGCGSRSSDAATPTATPTTEASATPEVTASPTATPVATPTAAPTEAPTPAPTATPSPAPTATPTPAPTATPSPAPEKPFVKKHPENVTVSEGGSCFFEADYINAIWAVWHFVSPDGTVDLTYENTGSRFPNMQVKNGMYSKMELSNIPLEANGWKVYCRYTNAGGYTDTNTATLTVTSAAPGDFPVVGSYMDSVSQRASMEITGVPGAYSARIHWGSSAWESTEWEFSGSFGTDGVMHFNNAAKYNVVYDASGRETRTALYTNGAGTLT